MPDSKEFRFGAYSGLLAVIMVVALAVMAFMALEPAPVQYAANDFPVAEQSHQPEAPPVDISKL
jgi:hypothetical protein